MKGSGFLFLIGAVVIGRFQLGNGSVAGWGQQLIDGGLVFLLFSIGFDMIRRKDLVKLFDAGVFRAAAAAIVGSVVGAVMGGLVAGVAPPISAMIGEGMGWYSLAGAILAKTSGAGAAGLAVAANLWREVMALALMSWLSFKPISALALCGATAMDVSLGAIRRILGEQWIPMAFGVGMISSVVVAPLMWATARLFQ